MNKKILLGSQTAKQGFQNERDIILKFENWENDVETKLWLQIMDYNFSEIQYVKAVVISGHKTDVQVQITIQMIEAINVENLQIKLVTNLRGFNQIVKRWVDKYNELWEIPKNIIKLLKLYTGELLPTIKTPN